MSVAHRMFCRAMFRPTLAVHDAMCLLGRWRRWDWVDEHVLLGCAPRRRDVERLATAGVSALVNMCAEFAGYDAELAAAGIEHIRLPTLDYTCPHEQDLRRGVDFIRGHVASRRKVYVHCKTGRTRSAALVLCYLVRDRNISAERAFTLLRTVRPQITRNLHLRSPIRKFIAEVADS